MKKYICTVCGYIYDEAEGIPEEDVAPGTSWEELPEGWICPVCGATKDEFEEVSDKKSSVPQENIKTDLKEDDLRELSCGELSALCSNLAKGCQKQYRMEESALFMELAEFYSCKAKNETKYTTDDLSLLVSNDITSGYSDANAAIAKYADRGALRALVWGEKVTKILSSLISRYEKQKGTFLENTNVFVCEICGFVYVGDEAPDICPVCKVPKLKISQIKRGA